MPKKKKVSEDLQCGHSKCLKTFKVGESAIQCDNCQLWFHSECSQLDDESFTFLQNIKSQNILWNCDTCLSKKNECDPLRKDLSKQQEEVKIIKQTLVNLEVSMSKNFEKLEKSFNSKVNNQKTDLVKSYSEAVRKIKKNLPNNQVILSINKNLISVKQNMENNAETEKENKSKAAKMNNVCIFNIPELDSEDEEAKFNSDVTKLKELLDGKIKLEPNHIKAIFRVGKSQSDSKPRPVILKLTNTEIRTEFLKLRNLNLEEAGQKWSIFIHPDRTRQEQIKHKALISELKQRRDNGEQHLVIRGDKIIESLPFRKIPQSFWGEAP